METKIRRDIIVKGSKEQIEKWNEVMKNLVKHEYNDSDSK